MNHLLFSDPSASASMSPQGFDDLIGELANDPLTMDLIKNLILLFFSVTDLSFKLVQLVDKDGEARLSSIPVLTGENWNMIGKVYLYVMMNFNEFARFALSQQMDKIPAEMLPHVRHLIHLSKTHLDLKISCSNLSGNITKFLRAILQLISSNMTDQTNHFTGETFKKIV